MEQLLLVENHKLDAWPLNEDLRPIQANLKWHLHGIIWREILLV
jgi:hypothetical protein